MARNEMVDVDGCQIYYEERGEGEPLLLLHGFTGAGSDWQHVFPAGAPDGFRAVRADLRGHGRSTNPSTSFTFRQSASDMFALLDRIGIGRFKAIGMSAGAKTLLHMATRQPERVDAMVLVSATPYFPAQVRAAMAQLSFDALGAAERDAMRARHAYGDDQIRMLFEQGRGFKDSYDDMAFTPPLLATIAARTLVVHGDRDPFYPVEMAMALYRAIPTSALWVVPHGDHGPIFGKMAAPFVETALGFLRSA